jgi:hypothetical protein
MDNQWENSIHNSPRIADFRLQCCILKEDTKNKEETFIKSCYKIPKIGVFSPLAKIIMSDTVLILLQSRNALTLPLPGLVHVSLISFLSLGFIT